MARSIFIVCLFLIPSIQYASTNDTLIVFSHSMNNKIANIVIIPDDYPNAKQPFPVLYLLHGADGDHGSWLQVSPELINYADQHRIIIVCPNASPTSWYFDSPIDASMKYETYVAGELIQAVDGRFNTIKNRSGRAITGLSMGGHGALYLACKHPEIYGAAGSTSGGVDIRPFPKSWDIAKRLGEMETHGDNWENNTVINLISLLADENMKIIFDCGTDDFFYNVNKALHEKMLTLKIPHDYIVRPGGHSKAYWENAIDYQILFFVEYFKKAAIMTTKN